MTREKFIKSASTKELAELLYQLVYKNQFRQDIDGEFVYDSAHFESKEEAIESWLKGEYDEGEYAEV